MNKLIILLDGKKEDYTHISHDETVLALKNNIELIITPNTTFFSTLYIPYSDNEPTKHNFTNYMVYVKQRNKEICLNELYKKGKIRYAQNAEKILMSGAFSDLGIEPLDVF